jgi:hypothetical protein
MAVQYQKAKEGKPTKVPPSVAHEFMSKPKKRKKKKTKLTYY